MAVPVRGAICGGEVLDYLKSARSRLESEVLLRYRTLKSRGVEDTQKPPISHLLVFELRERGREKCFRPPLSVHAGVAVTGSSKAIRDLDFSAGLSASGSPRSSTRRFSICFAVVRTSCAAKGDRR